MAKPSSSGELKGFYRLARDGTPTLNEKKAATMSSGWIGTIIGVLVVIVLVIVILQLT